MPSEVASKRIAADQHSEIQEPDPWMNALRAIGRGQQTPVYVNDPKISTFFHYKGVCDPGPERVDYRSYFLSRLWHTQNDQVSVYPRDELSYWPDVPQHRTALVLFGERFYWAREEVLGVVLKHRHFGLLGYGDSHSEAASMLVQRTIELAEALVPRAGETLPPMDDGGRRLQAYLTHVLQTVESL